MFDLLPNTVALLRALDQAKLRFHFAWMNVLFTGYITDALAEVLWNATALLTLRSGGKQTSSSVKADFSHCFWKCRHLHGCLTRMRMVSVFSELLMWSLFKINFYPFPLSILILYMASVLLHQSVCVALYAPLHSPAQGSLMWCLFLPCRHLHHPLEITASACTYEVCSRFGGSSGDFWICLGFL